MKKVICKSCNTHIYNFKPSAPIKNRPMNADDFEGVNGFENPIKGDWILCPSCFCILNPETVKENEETITIKRIYI